MRDFREKIIKYYERLFPSQVLEDPERAIRFVDNISKDYHPIFLEALEKEIKEMEEAEE